MNKSFLILVLGVFLSTAVFSQKTASLIEHYQNEYQTFKEFIKYSKEIQGDTNIDVKFYYIDIEIGLYSPYISGDVTILFEPTENNLNEIFINLNSALTVGSISAPCESFYQDNDVIVIAMEESYNPGDLVELTISYQGIPVEAGGYKGLRYETHGENEPIIATLSTPYLAHYWYPCKDGPQDKPDSVYMDITLPDEEINGVQVMGISNGLLENIIDNGDTRTFQWRHRYPVVTYYVMAAVSNYVFFQDEFDGGEGNSFPLDYYVFQEHLTTAQTGVSDLPEVIQLFSDVFGPYPFRNEKYGMTQLGFYGAIENQTNTIQNNLSSSWFETTIHELGHMWFGDMITLANWHHGWLNEGFATYSEALWDEHLYGFEGYKSNMDNNQYWLGGTLYLENAADTFNTFQPIIYSKGAYAVHMLRGILGNDLFFEALLDYSQSPDFMYRNADTEDLQASFESSSGMDLDYFFEEWVYDEYWPHYYYNFEQNTDNKLYFVIHQAQEELYGYRPVFVMPVDVRIVFTSGGDTTISVWNDQQTQTYSIDLDQEVYSIHIDPDKWILRKAQYKTDIPVSVADQLSPESIQLFPNPFTNSMTITISENSYKSLKVTVYDLQGKQIKRLFDGDYRSGTKIYWDGSNASGKRLEQGVYLLEFQTKNNTFSKRAILN